MSRGKSSYHLISYMVAANGDTLFIGIDEGVILPSTDADFDFMFHDPFTISGGKGIFEGASGSGITNSFVTQQPEKKDHEWVGILKLPK